MRSWDYRHFRLVPRKREMILKVGFLPQFDSIGFWDQYQQRQSAEWMARELSKRWAFGFHDDLLLKVMASKHRQ